MFVGLVVCLFIWLYVCWFVCMFVGCMSVGLVVCLLVWLYVVGLFAFVFFLYLFFVCFASLDFQF